MDNPLNSTYLGRALLRAQLRRAVLGWLLLNPWHFLFIRGSR